MSVFSQLFNIGQGNLVKDPQRLVWGVALETMLGIGYIDSPSVNAAARTNVITGADFWTAITAAGDVAQVTVDDTYVTVTDVTTGTGGVLTHLILPGVTAGADIVTVKITVDGVEYALAFTADNATDRFAAGIMRFNTHDVDSYSTGIWGGSGLVSGLAFRYEGGTEAAKMGLHLDTPGEALSNSPCLRFDSTLKVEMKSSDFNATNNRDDCAAVYLLNQY